jgi:hypothetical protein
MSLHRGLARLTNPTARLLGACLALTLAATLLPADAAAAKKKRLKAGPAITGEYFGVHHAGLHADGPIGWPQAPVGSLRMWDNGVSWREIEVAPGVYDWTLIDAQMAKAAANGTSVLLVLGQTPTFHSTRPTVAGSYGLGASAMPTKAAWVAYVRAVAERNKTVWGGIADFQVWNEANVVGYWSGTPKQLANLTAWTDATLRSVDPSAKLVAPAMVTRLSGQRVWIKKFYALKVKRKNVSKYVDALSFQLYPLATGAPEASMTLLASVRAILRKYKVTKPIWNTEVNYGLVGGPEAGAAARPVSAEQQVGNVVRTYVLNAQNGVQRVYWYSWDLLGMSNTPMVAEDRISLTPAGQAYVSTRTWLLGARPAGCTVTKKKVYTCTFKAGAKVVRAVWNPKKASSFKLPSGTTSFAKADGTPVTKRGRKLTIGPVPVLVRGSR